MSEITNHSMTVGKHRVTVCEWINKDDSRCCDKPVFGKPYCRAHTNRAYRTVTVAEFEKETDSVISEITEIENSSVALEDEVAEDDGV